MSICAGDMSRHFFFLDLEGQGFRRTGKCYSQVCHMTGSLLAKDFLSYDRPWTWQPVLFRWEPSSLLQSCCRLLSAEPHLPDLLCKLPYFCISCRFFLHLDHHYRLHNLILNLDDSNSLFCSYKYWRKSGRFNQACFFWYFQAEFQYKSNGVLVIIELKNLQM